MKPVAIVDYGMSNVHSVARAVEECGGTPIVTDQARELGRASYIILPGVGSFCDGVGNLRQRSLDETLREQVIERETPLLAICLGMQMLARRGWEGRPADGLGWIDGEVERLKPTAADGRIPHVGWNEVELVRCSPLFRGLDVPRDFYFVHSYHLVCHDARDVVARTPYCGGFVSAIEKPPVFGVQFHPEKSQRAGFQVIRNFLAL